MEQYVALLIDEDGHLGPTVLCSSWQQAVENCIVIATDAGYTVTAAHRQSLEDRDRGYARLNEADAMVHIGGLEDPREDS